MTPLSYDTLEYASGFCSEQCPDGIVAVAGNTLRIITIERLGQGFNEKVMPLLYTPRKSCVLPSTPLMLIVEADHATAPASIKEATKDEYVVPYVAEAAEDEEEEEAEVLWDESVYGAPRSEEGEWASCIRLVDCKEGKTLQLIDLEDNEAAFSCCSV